MERSSSKMKSSVLISYKKQIGFVLVSLVLVGFFRFGLFSAGNGGGRDRGLSLESPGTVVSPVALASGSNDMVAHPDPEPGSTGAEMASPPATRDRSSVGAQNSINAYVTELKTLQEQGAQFAAPYERILRKMLELDEEAATQAILDFIENETLDFWGKVDLFAQLLENVDDPQIYSVSRGAFDREVARGNIGASAIGGYMKLMAIKGPRQEVIDEFLEIADQIPIGVVQSEVLRNLTDLDLTPAEVDKLLQSRDVFSSLDRYLYSLLASSGGEYALRNLTQSLLADDGVQVDSIAEGLGDALREDPARLENLVLGLPFSEKGDIAAFLIVGSAGQLASKAGLSNALWDRVRTSAMRTLQSGSADEASKALYVLRDFKEVRSPEFISIVEARMETWSPKIQVVARGVLYKLRQES